MRLNLNIPNSTELAEDYVNQLTATIKQHAYRAGKLLEIDILDINLFFNKDVIPETGEAAYAKQKLIEITIDDSLPDKEIEKIIHLIIPATIYHEMNHVARDLFVGESNNLLEAVIEEGIADLFAEEQWPRFKPPWTQYDSQEIVKFFDEFKRQMYRNDYSHDEWFFGAGNKPHWLGYHIGHYIVSIVVNNHHLSPVELTKKLATDIYKLSDVNKNYK